MCDMRRDGSGTYDHSTNTWKLRRKDKPTIAASVRKLAELFDVDLPYNERITWPYWCQYRDAIVNREKADATPYKRRAASLKRVIGQLEGEGRDATEQQAELQACLDAQEGNGDVQDEYCWHPDVEKKAFAYGIDRSDLLAMLALEKDTVTTIPAKESLMKEVDRYIDEYVKAGKTGVSEQRLVLGMLKEVCGNISVKEVTREHYTQCLDKIQASAKSKNTHVTRQKIVKAFLRAMEADHDVAFRFVDAKRYNFQGEDGQKVQYTIAQVKLALEAATGIERMALLLGLNCGFYWEDIAELKSEHMQGEYLNKCRHKHRKLPSPLINSWYLWSETKEALQYGVSYDEAYNAYEKLRQRTGIPEHKALRKTMIQWVLDTCGLEAARLYKSEKVPGCIGKNYVKLSPAQKRRLTVALIAMHRKLFDTWSV